MNFIDINEEINVRVISTLSKIGNLINGLVDNDLSIVYSLARNPLNGSNQQVTSLISKLMGLYEELKKMKK